VLEQLLRDSVHGEQLPAQHEERFVRRALIRELLRQPRLARVLRDVTFEVRAELEVLLGGRHQELAGQRAGPVERVTQRAHLLREVVAEQDPSIGARVSPRERQIDSPEEELQLEEQLFPASDVQPAQPSRAISERFAGSPALHGRAV
jgi:hypothetical protein